MLQGDVETDLRVVAFVSEQTLFAPVGFAVGNASDGGSLEGKVGVGVELRGVVELVEGEGKGLFLFGRASRPGWLYRGRRLRL